MKHKITILLLVASFSVVSFALKAGALKPDCTAKKAGKNMAMKATVGVGGRCSAADAATDSAKDIAGIEENDKGNNKDKGKHKGQDKDDDKDSNDLNPLKKDDKIGKKTLKKIVK